MSESATEPAETPAEQPQEGEQQHDDETKTFDADYVAKLRKEAAKYRTEAKANAEAAKKLSEIEEANKTAEQKAAERLAEVEKRAAELAAREARADVAADTGIPVALLSGPEDSSPEAIKAYADLLAKHFEDAGKPRQPKPDRNQGRSSSGSSSTADQFAASVGGLL